MKNMRYDSDYSRQIEKLTSWLWGLVTDSDVMFLQMFLTPQLAELADQTYWRNAESQAKTNQLKFLLGNLHFGAAVAFCPLAVFWPHTKPSILPQWKLVLINNLLFINCSTLFFNFDLPFWVHWWRFWPLWYIFCQTRHRTVTYKSPTSYKCTDVDCRNIKFFCILCHDSILMK